MHADDTGLELQYEEYTPWCYTLSEAYHKGIFYLERLQKNSRYTALAVHAINFELATVTTGLASMEKEKERETRARKSLQ